MLTRYCLANSSTRTLKKYVESKVTILNCADLFFYCLPRFLPRKSYKMFRLMNDFSCRSPYRFRWRDIHYLRHFSGRQVVVYWVKLATVAGRGAITVKIQIVTGTPLAGKYKNRYELSEQFRSVKLFYCSQLRDDWFLVQNSRRGSAERQLSNGLHLYCLWGQMFGPRIRRSLWWNSVIRCHFCFFVPLRDSSPWLAYSFLSLRVYKAHSEKTQLDAEHHP